MSNPFRSIRGPAITLGDVASVDIDLDPDNITDEELAAQEAAKAAEEAGALQHMGELVAQIPTKKQFDEWIAGFPEHTQDQVREQMAPFCSFPLRVTLTDQTPHGDAEPQ